MIMGKYSLLFFIVCFLFFIPGFSSAQVKITLDSCIARALELSAINNGRLKIT